VTRRLKSVDHRLMVVRRGGAFIQADACVRPVRLVSRRGVLGVVASLNADVDGDCQEAWSMTLQ
jgi:hypothetical protein